MSTRKFQSRDLVLQAGEFEFGEITQHGSDSTTTCDISLVARTSSAVSTIIGDLVHDLKGMFHKEKVNLDWRHDSNESLGYLDQFDISNDEVACKGKLVSIEPGDRASKIMKQAAAGIPFESSIFFGGQGIEVEDVSHGECATVNGSELTGPKLIIRKWPLRGVALCPYGMDNDTSLNFNFEDGDVEYTATILGKDEDSDMSDEIKMEVAETPEKKEVTKLEAPKPEAIKLTGPISSDGHSGKDFIGAFGESGALWFAEGKNFMEATVLYIEKLEGQVGDLTKRLDAAKLDSGGNEALDSDDGDVDKKKLAFDATVNDLTNKIGPNAAKFAASLTLPSK